MIRRTVIILAITITTSTNIRMPYGPLRLSYLGSGKNVPIPEACVHSSPRLQVLGFRIWSESHALAKVAPSVLFSHV